MIAHRNLISGLVHVYEGLASGPTRTLTPDEAEHLRQTLTDMSAETLLDYLDRGFACMLTKAIVARAGLDKPVEGFNVYDLV